MNTDQLNLELNKVYELYYEELRNLFEPSVKKDLSLPLLTYVFPEYKEVDRKIMMVGQETKGWRGNLASGKSIEDIISCYKNFELGKNYYNSPFWRFSKGVFWNFNPSNDTKGMIWTNLSKVDLKGKKVNRHVEGKNKVGYQLLRKEMAILKPQIVIFLTSWFRDKKIQEIFLDSDIVELNNIKRKYLVKVKSDNLPENTFRTYHPRFLNSRRSKYTIDQIIEKIGINYG